MNRKPIFDAVDALEPGIWNRPGAIAKMDAAIDEAMGKGPTPRKVGPKGIALMHRWEGCRLTAYPDPGSANGEPWTIGWGSTGPGVKKGVTWTQEQADARFEQDLVKYARDVEKALGGAPTTQEQFDALVSFHYNTGKIASATLTRRHKEGRYDEAAAEFGRWVFNDGKRMQGLANRRADEAALYRAGSPK